MEPTTDRDQFYPDDDDDFYFEDAHDQHSDYQHDDYQQHGAFEYRDPDYYWRRRFLVLAGGLAIVGLITVGLSTLLGPAKPETPRGAAPASLAARNTPPPVGAHSPAAPAVAPARHASSSLASSQAASCSPSAMVLSLFTAKPQYGPGQQPRFEVYAVSTAPGACTLAFGPSFVQVVVVWHGQVLWDSAQCPLSLSTRHGTATGPVRFTQGVPQVTALSWNREASNPGCAGSVPAGVSGRVDAVVLAAGKSSPVRSFTLSR